MLSLVGLLALAAPAPSAVADPIPLARRFLAAYISDPSSTRSLVQPEAVFAYIDMGGRYADMLTAMGSQKPALAACALQSVTPIAPATLLDQTSDSAATAVYLCPTADKTPPVTVDVSLYFRAGLVSGFGIVPRRR